jgi:mono/diheme cytochrome c family protein
MDRIPRVPRPLRAARRKAGFVVAVTGAAALLAAGCDVQEDADLERGRTLFQNNCGTCHALAEAGTTSQVGPDLDASFAAARETGMDQDTIEGVVENQIYNPRDALEGDPDYDKVYMPAEIVTGEDAEAVAAYVASVAGIPGIEPPPLGTAAEVFLERCGSCHSLEAAGSAGTTGPDLDEVLPGQQPEQVGESIRDPNADISPGFDEPSQMPVFDEGQIPNENLGALIEYLLACAGDAGSPECEAAGQEETAAAPTIPGSAAKPQP